MTGPGILGGPLRVVNVGLELFAETLEADGVEVIHVDWRPPAGGDPRLLALLVALDDEPGSPASVTDQRVAGHGSRTPRRRRRSAGSTGSRARGPRGMTNST
jgi:hypothetical protein